MSALVTPGQNAVITSNQLVPDEGPKAMPITLQFATAASLVLDLTNLQQQGWISMVQTLYVDASQATQDTTITIGQSGQVIVAVAGTQGYYNVLVPNPVRITFANSSGSDIVNVFAINVMVPPAVWTA